VQGEVLRDGRHVRAASRSVLARRFWIRSRAELCKRMIRGEYPSEGTASTYGLVPLLDPFVHHYDVEVDALD
jgi:hypothetical protein